MSSKDAPQKILFLGAIKKVAGLGTFHTKRKVAEKPDRFGRHLTKVGPNPNVLVYSKSHRGKYAYMIFFE